MVRLAAELALDVGGSRAQLRLLARPPGHRVEIGPSFHDCQDGDMARGRAFTVDLLVSPGLCRVADGRRGDARVEIERVLVPAEIYPTSYDEA